MLIEANNQESSCPSVHQNHSNNKLNQQPYLQDSNTSVSINSQQADKLKSTPSTDSQFIILSNNWLKWQCQMAAGVIQGAIFSVEDREIPTSIACWPTMDVDEELIHVAKATLQQDKGLILSKKKYSKENQGLCDFITSQIMINEKCIAVVVLMVTLRSEHQQNSIQQLLQWGGLWFSILENQQLSSAHNQEQSQLQLSNSLLKHSSSKLIAIDAVNQLAKVFDCERISLGIHQNPSVKMLAISSIANFENNSQLVQQIEALMEEAIEQNQTITEPKVNGNEQVNIVLNKAHQDYSFSQGKAAICTLVLRGRSGKLGAITLERSTETPFTSDELVVIDKSIQNIGLILARQFEEEQPIAAKYKHSSFTFLRNIFSSKRLRFKCITGACVLAIILSNIIKVPYKVTAPAYIEGSIQQLLVASQNGFIEQANLRAGDSVKKGEVVAVLDDKQLKLELTRWQSEHNKFSQEYQEALAKRERSRLSIIKAQLDKVDAEILLVQEKINHTQIISPFEGVVLSGDLSQSLGAPVETGQLLFEVAPIDSYRLVIEIPEADVAGIVADVEGIMITSALPNQEFEFTIDQIMPIASVKNGVNHFRFEGSLKQPSPILRPGMQGFAKVILDERDLFWIWSHNIVNKFKLWLWSMGF